MPDRLERGYRELWFCSVGGKGGREGSGVQEGSAAASEKREDGDIGDVTEM